MTPFAAADQELERLEVEREAWSAYRAALVGLTGREYENAEDAAWEVLQRRLDEIAH
jgi:hypothetical protein